MNSFHLFDLFPLWITFLFVITTILGAVWIGVAFSGWKKNSNVEDDEPINTIVGANLALLAFILAFTFGLTTTRFDAKKMYMLEEVNAIETTWLRSGFKNWLEKKVYVHIPFYKTFLDVANQVAGKEKEKYPVVEIDLYGNNNKVLGLLTETLVDGRHIVYTPFAPVKSFGQVHIVAKENVKVLSVSIKDATEIISRIGFEINKFYKEK